MRDQANYATTARKPPVRPDSTPRTLAAIGNYRVDYRDGVLEFYSPYNPGLIAALKNAIPYTHRVFKKNPARWEITADFADALSDVVLRFAGIDLQLPTSSVHKATTADLRLLEIRYVGRVKARPDGSESAFGWANGGWNVIVPGDVLRGWFGDAARPGEARTLYAVLGVDKQASGVDIKKAWRRAAMQWHPDHCSEPGAADQFRAIQSAYEVLSDAGKRARYDAGLMLEASLGQSDNVHTERDEWQPPLRCGYVMANGVDRLGRFIVDSILAWEDIHDAEGRVLVTSWPMGADTFMERWI